jgi:hypothetical protein
MVQPESVLNEPGESAFFASPKAKGCHLRKERACRGACVRACSHPSTGTRCTRVRMSARANAHVSARANARMWSTPPTFLLVLRRNWYHKRRIHGICNVLLRPDERAAVWTVRTALYNTLIVAGVKAAIIVRRKNHLECRPADLIEGCALSRTALLVAPATVGL